MSNKLSSRSWRGGRRQVVKETTNAYLAAWSSVEKIRANENALSSAEQSIRAIDRSSPKGFYLWRGERYRCTNSVQNEFKARRDLLKAQYNFITNLFILNRWAGKLPEESVDSVNVWLGGVDAVAQKSASIDSSKKR